MNRVHNEDRDALRRLARKAAERQKELENDTARMNSERDDAYARGVEDVLYFILGDAEATDDLQTLDKYMGY